MTEDEILKEKIEVFYKHKLPVHIKRKDAMFFNGLILEYTEGMIILEDRKLGSMPIMFVEIEQIEKMRGEDDGLGE